MSSPRIVHLAAGQLAAFRRDPRAWLRANAPTAPAAPRTDSVRVIRGQARADTFPLLAADAGTPRADNGGASSTSPNATRMHPRHRAAAVASLERRLDAQQIRSERRDVGDRPLAFRDAWQAGLEMGLPRGDR